MRPLGRATLYSLLNYVNTLQVTFLYRTMEVSREPSPGGGASNDSPVDGGGDTASDYVSGMSISVRRGTAFLRKQNVRAKAYSELYYKSSRLWSSVYYLLHGAVITIGVVQTIVGLILQILKMGEQVVFVSTAGGAVITGIGAVMMVLNPGNKEKEQETAGDNYESLAEDLELFDPETSTQKEINDLVKTTLKRIKKLRKACREPDRKALNAKKTEIVERIRAARESLLYIDSGGVDPVVDGRGGGSNGVVNADSIDQRDHGSNSRCNTIETDLSGENNTLPPPIESIVVVDRSLSPRTFSLQSPPTVPSTDIYRDSRRESLPPQIVVGDTTSTAAIDHRHHNHHHGDQHVETAGDVGSVRKRLSGSASSFKRPSVSGEQYDHLSRRSTLMDLGDGSL